MSALESPFEKWGMPKPGVTAAQIAAWFAAQPDFHDHAPDYVGSAISAQDDWAQGDSRNGYATHTMSLQMVTTYRSQ